MGQFTDNSTGMGRRSFFADTALSAWPNERHKQVAEALHGESAFVLFEVKLDGDYDDGGVYWGGGQPLYCLRSADGNETEIFERADSPEEAIAAIRQQLGPAFADVPVTVVDIEADFGDDVEEDEENAEAGEMRFGLDTMYRALASAHRRQHHSVLREVFFEPLTDGVKYHLLLWDTDRTDPMGKSVVGYAFASSTPGWFDDEGNPCPTGPNDGWARLLFHGEDYAVAPAHPVDSDDAVRSLLFFLTLKPGDTDDEYFEGYTPEQMDFVQSAAADALSLWADEDAAEPIADFDGFFE